MGTSSEKIGLALKLAVNLSWPVPSTTSHDKTCRNKHSLPTSNHTMESQVMTKRSHRHKPGLGFRDFPNSENRESALSEYSWDMLMLEE